MFKQLLTQYSTMQKKSDGEFETKVRGRFTVPVHPAHNSAATSPLL